ncbi:hypothetical protein D7X74_16830 [Corallococcus sp. CA047B]|uniref:5'-methylthioadenosine/S-adenosylhomocysteine nucleosidase family protein n=1 Tax=Corallococcus sp. CA047B TaxID=2316729 RepID=UPI000EA02DD4|nr:hypothetical protein [Corallococcus sp. CA047B]RKH15984.1 hypothetical protein D7X74_16830 [Corallococcus sp. CA047B]
MNNIDVLIITALKEEHDAARDAALIRSKDGSGISAWEEHDGDTNTPYLVGDYEVSDRHTIRVALARPTRMGGTATASIAAGLAERLRPRCLAMCGVCAGNPGDLALGDVIIAEMVYAYDEGKRKQTGTESDHRQIPMLDTWVRAAQDLVPDGLPSFGDASAQEADIWLLERLLAGEDPRYHTARARYFPRGTWGERLSALEAKGLVSLDGLKLSLSQSGRQFVERILALNVDGPEKLPFRIKVGPIASGNVVVKDGVTWDQLRDWGVRSVLGLEMEAATIGSIAHRLGLSGWVVVKSVMDHADPRKDDRYKLFAARASAEVLFKFLSKQVTPPVLDKKIARDESGIESVRVALMTVLEGRNPGNAKSAADEARYLRMTAEAVRSLANCANELHEVVSRDEGYGSFFREGYNFYELSRRLQDCCGSLDVLLEGTACGPESSEVLRRWASSIHLHPATLVSIDRFLDRYGRPKKRDYNLASDWHWDSTERFARTLHEIRSEHASLIRISSRLEMHATILEEFGHSTS